MRKPVLDSPLLPLIERVAHIVRAVLLKDDPDAAADGLSGYCYVSSSLIMRELEIHGIDSVRMEGEIGTMEHVWLKVFLPSGELLVDATLTQFKKILDCPSVVIGPYRQTMKRFQYKTWRTLDSNDGSFRISTECEVHTMVVMETAA